MGKRGIGTTQAIILILLSIFFAALLFAVGNIIRTGFVRP